MGDVRRVASSPGGKRLRIDLGAPADGLSVGDSVSVSGVCLTAAVVDGAEAEFDVVGETLSKSTLSGLASGAKVNIERALAAGDALDGHIVQGHVDAVAAVAAVREEAGQRRIEFASRELAAMMVSKGSVAIDGASLTLTDVSSERFAVALIPTTLADTTLATLKVGDAVNVEVDIIGKYVRRYLEQLAPGVGGLTLEKLRDAGLTGPSEYGAGRR